MDDLLKTKQANRSIITEQLSYLFDDVEKLKKTSYSNGIQQIKDAKTRMFLENIKIQILKVEKSLYFLSEFEE